MVTYIKNNSRSEAGIWGTNIFGKSIEEMIMDGMKNKISMINDESQVKLQDTMQKIVNRSDFPAFQTCNRRFPFRTP